MSDSTDPSTRQSKRSALKRKLKSVASRLGSVRPKKSFADEALVQILNADGVEIHTANVPTGTTLLTIARQAKIDIDHYCGGQCSCGTCRVNIHSGANNLSRMCGMEEMVLGAAKTQNGCRLACQARVQGPVSFQVPRWF